MKVLNLYACLGGNRLLWEDCEVTAVELDPVLAELYKERFPNDTVIVGDAHQYLLDHYGEFDFIWSSPPCPTHSMARYWNSSNSDTTTKPVYPDLKLYEEIILLKHYFKGKYTVENVIPYYEPLIPGLKRGRHIYWTNFLLPNDIGDRKNSIMTSSNELNKWCDFHKYDFTKYNGDQLVIKIARNLVDYEAGLTIFNAAKEVFKKKNEKQIDIFDVIE